MACACKPTRRLLHFFLRRSPCLSTLYIRSRRRPFRVDPFVCHPVWGFSQSQALRACLRGLLVPAIVVLAVLPSVRQELGRVFPCVLIERRRSVLFRIPLCQLQPMKLLIYIGAVAVLQLFHFLQVDTACIFSVILVLYAAGCVDTIMLLQ